MAKSYYRKPYLDSGVFIAWIKGEVIKEKDAQGNEVYVNRGRIGESILALAESNVYPIIVSALTLVEVHKKKGKEKLLPDQNQNVLDYFQHDFINVVTIDRNIGEEANRLCVQHEDKKLSPCDAIHLACAKKAGCDVLLSWDDGLNSIVDPSIRIERPVLQEIPEGPLTEGALTDQQQIFPFVEANESEEAQSNNSEPEVTLSSSSTNVRGSSSGHPQGEAGAEENKGQSAGTSEAGKAEAKIAEEAITEGRPEPSSEVAADGLSSARPSPAPSTVVIEEEQAALGGEKQKPSEQPSPPSAGHAAEP